MSAKKSKETAVEEAVVEETQDQEVVVEDESQTLVPKQGINTKSKILIGIVVAVIAALISGLIIVLNDRNDLKSEVTKLSQANAVDEAKDLNATVSKIVELPTDEVPTVGTVADANKLKQQSSGFTNAQTGDKLLIYTKSQQIIVYRPSSKKIVNIVQISLNQQAQTGINKNQ